MCVFSMHQIINCHVLLSCIQANHTVCMLYIVSVFITVFTILIRFSSQYWLELKQSCFEVAVCSALHGWELSLAPPITHPPSDWLGPDRWRQNPGSRWPLNARSGLNLTAVSGKGEIRAGVNPTIPARRRINRLTAVGYPKSPNPVYVMASRDYYLQ